MPKKEVSLDRLDEQLRRAAKTLARCGHLIADLEFNSRENLRKIGQALVRIYEVQNKIYERRLDLTPEYLKKDWGRPWPGTRGAEEELKELRDTAWAHRHYVEWLERRIGELEETVNQNNKEGG